MYHIVKREGVNHARLKIRDGRRGSPLRSAVERGGVQSVGIAATILKALAAAGGVSR